MSEGTLFEVEGPAESLAHGQWRLSRIQVLDWGTFSGHHDLPVPRRGLLLTGESGSGKSSLLDAMSTILVPPGEVHFNAAATDAAGGDRDRTPMSYVRGAHRKRTDEDTQEIRTAYLREGPTSSAVALTWTDGQGGVVSAVRVFHVRGRSLQAQDLRTAFVLLDGEVELPAWKPVIASGIDRRRIKVAFPGAFVQQTYTAFEGRLRARLGIRSQTAMRLLHRALSAKSLRSLDALLRGFMLDEPETFELADNAVEQFVQLRSAHDAVVDAREQVDVLEPLRPAWESLARGRHRRDLAERGMAHLPVFQAVIDERDARRELARVRDEELALAAAREDLGMRNAATEAEYSSAREALLRSGGGEIERAQAELHSAEADRDQVERDREAFLSLLGVLGAEEPGSREEHLRIVEMARQEGETLAAARDSMRFDAPMGARAQARERAEALEKEIRSLSRRRTRLPATLVAVRDALAEDLGVPPTVLPFAGELADIEDPAWAGALERLMRGFAVALVVPEEHFAAAAAWIDTHHLGLRLDVERADLEGGEVPRTDPASAARKLRVAPGRFEHWMHRQLARRFPHICLEDATDLDRHDRALTRNGLVKDRRHLVKDDRFRLEDPGRWIIGTSNADLVDHLRGELDEVREAVATAQRQIDAIDAEQAERVTRMRLLDRVVRTTWESVDVEHAHARVVRLGSHLDVLVAAHSDLEPLRVEVARLEEVRLALADEGVRVERTEGALTNRREECERVIEEAGRTLEGARRDPELEEDLERRVRAHGRVVDRTRIKGLVEKVRQDLQVEARSAQGLMTASENTIQRQETLYTERWRGHSANLLVDVAATPDFLALLERLQADRLPEFETRFRRLLAEQSQQNLSSLNWQIQKAAEEVAARIAPVNESLALTPFDAERGRYLRIQAKDVRSGEVRDFLSDMRAVTEESFGSEQETQAQAERRFERMNTLLERLGSADPADRAWRTRVLDTRLHLTFIAVERDAQGNQTDVYQGSGGRSGGQGQKLVTFCLAAALRYQLADTGQQVPRYGTVALDEAFDKTDANFTRAGLRVFDAFRFQLVLATPLKMLQTIEEHVGGVAMVSNPGGTDSTMSFIRFEDQSGDGDAHP